MKVFTPVIRVCFAPRDVFLTASARAYQKHVLHERETIPIFVFYIFIRYSCHEMEATTTANRCL